MKKEEKLTFWKKLKFSIIDFDKYQDLATVKISSTIGYIAILLCIFSLIATGIYVYKFSVTINDIRTYIDKNIETISFEDNELEIIQKSDKEKKTIENTAIGIKIMINTNLQDEQRANESINEISTDGTGILILKDKFLIKNSLINESISYSYKNLAEQFNINKLDKQETLNLLSFETVRPLLFNIFVILFIYFFVILYLPSTLIDIVILSFVGYIVSSVVKIRIKYSAIYNIAAYSLTLSILLNMLYFIIHGFSGFTIKYFDIMYTTIASIYIITAILMIRSDIIKKQIELTKIIEEQERVRAEIERREEEQKEQEEREKQKKEEKKRKQDEKNKKEGNIGKQPEGNKV